MKRLLDMLFFSFSLSTFKFLMIGFMCWSFEGGAVVYRVLFGTFMFCYFLVFFVDALYGDKTSYFYNEVKKKVNEL